MDTIVIAIITDRIVRMVVYVVIVNVLKLRRKPSKIVIGKKELPEIERLNEEGWHWIDLNDGGILELSKSDETEVSIHSIN